MTLSVPNPLLSERSSMLPRPDFFSQLNHETQKIERMKNKQEEIALRKLEKEALIRKRNDDI
jgi:hypothetical protein